MPHKSASSPAADPNGNNELYRYINLKLAALGQPTSIATEDPEFLELAGPLQVDVPPPVEQDRPLQRAGGPVQQLGGRPIAPK